MGLVFAAFIDPWSGLIIGVLASVIIFLQPLFSDMCLKNTAADLNLGEVILAEGSVTYLTKNQEQKGKLFLYREKLVFVYKNQIDFSLAIAQIEKVIGETSEIDYRSLSDVSQVLEKKSPVLPEVAALVIDIANLSSGLIRLTVEQSFFRNEFSFVVSNPFLWVKKINQLIANRAG